MIVWSGKGFLSVLVLVGAFVLFNSIIPREYNAYGFALSFFIAAAFSWFFGKKWNDEQGKPLLIKQLDKK